RHRSSPSSKRARDHCYRRIERLDELACRGCIRVETPCRDCHCRERPPRFRVSYFPLNVQRPTSAFESVPWSSSALEAIRTAPLCARQYHNLVVGFGHIGPCTQTNIQTYSLGVIHDLANDLSVADGAACSGAGVLERYNRTTAGPR